MLIVYKPQMEYLEPKINQLIIEVAGQPKKIVRSFSTRPTKSLSTKLGKIFGLIEIESNDPQIDKLIDLIIDEIKNNYYYSLNLKEENISDLNINSHFESALKKTNLSIASFLESEQITVDLEKVNIVIAVSNGIDINFTLTGEIGIILLYNISPSNYRIIDILDNVSGNSTIVDPLKFFSQVISGRVRQKDILFITTSNVLDYFSLEKIKNIITDKSPSEGAARLRQLLGDTGSQENFGAIILELEKNSLPAKKPILAKEFNYKQAASKDSIKELIDTEKETQKLLTPSVLPEIKKYAGLLNKAFQNYLNKVKGGTTSFYQRKKTAISKPLEKISNVKLKPIDFGPWKKTSEKIKINTMPLASFLSGVTEFVASRPVWSKLNSFLKKIFGRLAIKFKRLPASGKIILVAAVILLIIFSQSIIWLSYKKTKAENIKTFNQMLVDVGNKKNDAESSLIYRDENQARELLADAKNLLLSLDPPLKSQKEQASNLLNDLENKLNDLRHFVTINDPVQIANFKNFDAQSEIGPFLVLDSGNFYVQNRTNQSIYKTNLENQNIAEIKLPANIGKLSLAISINEKEIFFLNESKASFIFNPQEESISDAKVVINNNSNIADIASYNNRLYLLDADKNQIYRYSKIAGGYGDQSNWIKEEIDLKDATSLAIDGSIHVIKKNGDIISLLNGRKTDFKTDLIDPQIEAASKIKTSDASKYLYILDPPSKRLIVISKEGKLIDQYTSDKFDNLKDVAVVEDKKEIYILNGDKIFTIPAAHLEQ